MEKTIEDRILDAESKGTTDTECAALLAQLDRMDSYTWVRGAGGKITRYPSQPIKDLRERVVAMQLRAQLVTIPSAGPTPSAAPNVPIVPTNGADGVQAEQPDRVEIDGKTYTVADMPGYHPDVKERRLQVLRKKCERAYDREIASELTVDLETVKADVKELSTAGLKLWTSDKDK